jgi:hypothetical protein
MPIVSSVRGSFGSQGRFGKAPFIATGGTITTAGGFKIHTFSYTGSDQTFSVVSGSTDITAYIWGAAGGGSNAEGFSDPGGPGGYATGVIPVGAGSYLIQVGSGGGVVTGGGNTRPARAYPNGGLPPTRNGYFAGGGGGRSAIFANNAVSAGNARLIAGGGGGASGHGGGSAWAARGCTGGAGGGTTGGFGRDPYDGAEPNQDTGGTQSAGGVFATPTGNGGSAQFQGADVGTGVGFDSGGPNQAGGGGDGWYGGGWAANRHAGGGGGSGYLHSSVTSGTLSSATVNDGRYSSAIEPPESGNTYYQGGVGRGNVYATGGNGLIVIRYPL